MNRADHHKLIDLALPVLPERSRAFWAPLAEQLRATCMFPDEYAIALLNGEDGPWRHYFPDEQPKHSFEKLGAAARQHFFDTRFYVDGALAAMQRKDVTEACRFLGVLSHCLGDFGEPAHYYEYEITLLLPPPADRRNCNSHRLLEDVVSTVSAINYVPKVLGDTAGTIQLRLEGRLRELYELALAAIMPMLSALYRRDAAASAAHVNPVVGATAAVLADILHTLWCVHTGQWTTDERTALASCRLDAMEPAAFDVEFNYGCRPIRDAVTIDQVGHALPLQLRLAAANGGTRIEPVDGLCLVPHALPIRGTQYLSAVEFDLPPGAFGRFSCTAGLLAGHTPQAPCRFAVEADGRCLFSSGALTEASPAMCVDLSIAGCRRLRLVVHTDGSTDKLAFPIWGWPALHAS